MGITGKGTLLKRGDGVSPTEGFVAVAQITKMQLPEVISEYKDATHQASTVKEKGFNGLAELGSIKLTLHYSDTEWVTLHNDCKNGVAHNYQVSFGTGEILEFEAGIGTFSFPTIDFENLDLLKSDCELIPLGEWTFEAAPAG
jgi:hypothetical protein